MAGTASRSAAAMAGKGGDFAGGVAVTAGGAAGDAVIGVGVGVVGGVGAVAVAGVAETVAVGVTVTADADGAAAVTTCATASLPRRTICHTSNPASTTHAATTAHTHVGMAARAAASADTCRTGCAWMPGTLPRSRSASALRRASRM